MAPQTQAKGSSRGVGGCCGRAGHCGAPQNAVISSCEPWPPRRIAARRATDDAARCVDRLVRLLAAPTLQHVVQERLFPTAAELVETEGRPGLPGWHKATPQTSF